MKINATSEIKSFEFNASSTYIYYSIHKLNENNIATTTNLNATTGAWRLSVAVPTQTHQVFNFNPHLFTREIGFKQYELTDHLGNVRVVVSDIKEPENITNLSLGYHPSVLSSNDYFPFGMIMPGRSFNADFYRFGFNGMEVDREWTNTASHLDFGARIYDSRLGRWLSIDPYFKEYVPISPYAFSLNNPIYFVDADGNKVVDSKGNEVTVSVTNDGEGNYSAAFAFAEGTTDDVKKDFMKQGGRVIQSLIQVETGRDIVKNTKESINNIHIKVTQEKNVNGDEITLGGTSIKQENHVVDNETGDIKLENYNIESEINEGSINELSKRGFDNYDKNGLSQDQKVARTAGHELEHATNPVDVGAMAKGRPLTNEEHKVAKDKGNKIGAEYGTINKKDKK